MSLSAQCYKENRDAGISAYNSGELITALKCFRTALDTCNDKPKNNDIQEWVNKCEAEYLYSVGVTYYDKEEFENAIHAYIRCIEKDSSHYKAYNNLGYAYVDIGDYTKAIDALQKSLEIKKTPNAYFKMGDVYRKFFHDFDKAIIYYQEVIALQSDYGYGKAFFVLGLLYYRLERIQNAIDCFLEKVSIQPTDEAYFWLGLCYGKQEKPTEAIINFQEAIGINPKNADAYFMLGRIYYVYADKAMGVKYFKEAARLGNESAQEVLLELMINW